MESHVKLAIMRHLDLHARREPIGKDKTLKRLKDRMNRVELEQYQREIRIILREGRLEARR